MNGRPVVITHDLTKCYQRTGPPALDRLNLRIPKGALYGFVGPNGAGKTTTLRLLAGLLAPTSGEVLIRGHSMNVSPRIVRNYVGYMPDFFGVYHEMLAWEYLDFFARCYDLPDRRRRIVVAELLELVGLAEKRDADVGHLSRGMQQRLCLAHALVHAPPVLLLDEPASGLDPRARVEMRELLRELSAMGKTIILSSHILSDLAEICTEVGVVERGRLVASGPLSKLREQALADRLLRLHVLSEVEKASGLLEAFPGVTDVVRLNGTQDATGGWLEAYASGGAAAAADLLNHLVHNGVTVAEFRQVGNDLEELFLQLTAGKVA
jgi:ABC-2 type transport system ATP-binding protein